MQMDPRIILAGQAPDIIGSMGRGMQLRQQERDHQHVNSLRDMLQEYGPGIASGDQNALAQYARFDPAASLGIQQTRQSMDAQRLQLDMARAAASRAAATHAAQMDEVTRQREAQILERGIAMLTQATTPEAFARVMQMPGVAQAAEGMFGPGMATFENRNLLIAGALGVSDALSMGQQATQFRAATPEEAAQYGAAGGQFGPDGRFHPINPPSGLMVETLPDGTQRVVQGSGVARREASDAAAAANRQTSAGVVLQDIDRALSLMDAATLPTTGFGGNIVAGIPGTAASDISALMDTVGANIAFDALNRMRAASPTGGALGNVTERELALLQAAMGSLRQSQSPEQFRRNLMRLREQFAETVHGPQGGAPAASARPAVQPRQSPAQVAAPDEAVRMLLDDPSPDAQREFDAIFGAGAAQQILGAIR